MDSWLLTLRSDNVFMRYMNPSHWVTAMPSCFLTAWGLLCAVTEFVDHERRARSQEYRLDSAWFGQGAALKQRALEHALQLVS